jgi:hypothetical protein
VALNQNIRVCTHIKVNGIRCGSPALRSEVFCYFHQRMIRGVRTPPKSRLHPIALIENAASIQVSLMEVINALVRNTIDLRRAQLILRALQIAARNSRYAHLDLPEREMVREVPDYPDAPAPQKPEVPKEVPKEVHEVNLANAALSKAAILAVTPINPTRKKPPNRVISAAAPRTSAHGLSG